jgi:hypothetical protein
MQGLAMVEGDHENDEEDFLFEHKHYNIIQTFSELPKLWPPIISKH